MSNSDIKETERRKNILAALMTGSLHEALKNDIREWFYEDQGRMDKDAALFEVFKDHCNGSETTDLVTLNRLVRLKRKLGMPIPKYRVKGNRVIIPEFKPASKRIAGVKLPLNRQVLRYVAAILIPAIIILRVVLGVMPPDNELGMSNSAVVCETMVSAVKTIERIELSDGSSVRLMPGGQIRHNKSLDDGRHVELSGEAYFNVAKDTTQVFTVHTEHFKISVLGTEFKVTSPAGEDFSMVDLYQGSIRVDVGDDFVIMEPGQHLNYQHSATKWELTELDIAERIYDDMSGLVFDGQSLQEIFEVISNEYMVDIEVERESHPSWDAIYIDLTSARSMDELMRILSVITDEFTYEILSDRIIIKSAEK